MPEITLFAPIQTNGPLEALLCFFLPIKILEYLPEGVVKVCALSFTAILGSLSSGYCRFLRASCNQSQRQVEVSLGFTRLKLRGVS